MSKLNEVYKCNMCGNIVEIVHAGVGTLVCCNEPMVFQAANTVDASTEKHVPVIEVGPTSITVKVGSVAHPMEASHYIEWIELIADSQVYRQQLQPGQAPQATFPVTAKQVTAREYCNLHGHWAAGN